ncbi:MAG: MerR family transcriptional regulator [Deltaproteobacteria bacterium]|nr:MerR family transcriptional regulator [Deltaproteobacteria bacterium]
MMGAALHAPEIIPNKLYFRIGEVSDLLEVKPYVLRYWESEFPDIRPSKSKSGQRLYKRRDVEILLKIKELLYQERFTINGARKRLKEMVKNGSSKVVEIVEPKKREERPVVTPASKVEVVEAKPEQESIQKPTPSEVQEIPHSERRKLLLKLRKDLEILLEVVKS